MFGGHQTPRGHPRQFGFGEPGYCSHIPAEHPPWAGAHVNRRVGCFLYDPIEWPRGHSAEDQACASAMLFRRRLSAGHVQSQDRCQPWQIGGGRPPPSATPLPTHNALDHHGSDAGEHGLGHWGRQHSANRARLCHLLSRLDVATAEHIPELARLLM
jgi:hypothetical protein